MDLKGFCVFTEPRISRRDLLFIGRTLTESPSSMNINPSPCFRFQRCAICAGMVICFFEESVAIVTVLPLLLRISLLSYYALLFRHVKARCSWCGFLTQSGLATRLNELWKEPRDGVETSLLVFGLLATWLDFERHRPCLRLLLEESWVASLEFLPISLQSQAHYSGTEWVANPSLHWTSINYAPPTFDDALEHVTPAATVCVRKAD